eukprot:TRINITY_DN24668_c0_g1_i1.p1 TRINITY_DN24668_c0_g1~~TRINITY_DN24668_c0_g1_i1.p1  ORF type:complete len:221 (+),score=5.91 TRINITY_DN24668_c0_g1_i1:373-1035(+)
MEFCFRCSNPWHPGQKCEAVIQKDFMDYLQRNDVQTCPKCKSKVEKAEGCNHMTCTICKYQWCWLCSGKYTRFHYSKGNPLGCPGLQNAHHQKRSWPKWKIYSLRILRIILLVVAILLFPLTVYFGYAIIWYINLLGHGVQSRLHFLHRMFYYVFLLIFVLIFTPFHLIYTIISKLWNWYKRRQHERYLASQFNMELRPRAFDPGALRQIQIRGDADDMM